ncbi:HesB/IscA family protein [Prochlorothrix hollandica]|uniref:HesB/IscA family protein n=1 Tax=Prochlorothrix hollandica TaxID=1223 RepID=UPI000346CEE2|nr:iron-sulfur cluster assembly accessory protein [Prochlorothrix hollandica]
MVIQLSPAARAEILRFNRHCTHPPHRVRLGVQAGGCAGLHYTLEFNATTSPEDPTTPPNVQYDKDGIQILVDPALSSYIGQLSLDYVEDLTGGTFRFENSKAAQVCNCGQSFAL